MILDNDDCRKRFERLNEREKEMKCLYQVQDIVNHHYDIDDFLMQICKHIWGGWQYPIITRVKINLEKTGYKTDGLIDLHIVTDADIKANDSFASMIGRHTKGAKLIKKPSA